MGFVRGSFETETTNNILKIIRSLGFLDLATGPWVAGGAIRRVFMEQELNDGDIDIFRSSIDKKYNNALRIDNTLRNRGDFIPTKVTKIKTSSNYILNNNNLTYKVQIIHSRLFPSVEELLNNFDFTICMAATDGWDYIIDDRLLNDLKKRRIIINNPLQNNNWLIRLAKYCNYGFTPSPGTFSTIAGLNSNKFKNDLSEKGYMNVKNEY